jgi:hypothetical protein
MNAAVSKRVPPRRFNNREDFKKHGTAPPCPGRNPEAGSPHICDLLWFRCEIPQFMHVSPEQIFGKFKKDPKKFLAAVCRL